MAKRGLIKRLTKKERKEEDVLLAEINAAIEHLEKADKLRKLTKPYASRLIIVKIKKKEIFQEHINQSFNEIQGAKYNAKVIEENAAALRDYIIGYRQELFEEEDVNDLLDEEEREIIGFTHTITAKLEEVKPLVRSLKMGKLYDSDSLRRRLFGYDDKKWKKFAILVYETDVASRRGMYEVWDELSADIPEYVDRGKVYYLRSERMSASDEFSDRQPLKDLKEALNILKEIKQKVISLYVLQRKIERELRGAS